MINTTTRSLTLILGFCVFLSACQNQEETTVEQISQSMQPAVQSSTAPLTVIRIQDQQLLSQEYAAFRQSQISHPAYTLSLDLEADNDSFSGAVMISFEISENNSSPVTIDYDSGNIESIEVNGNVVNWDYEKWYISLAAELFTAGNNTINISYQRPFATDGAGLHKFTDPENGEIYLYTNFEPYDANRLFPHFDQPNLKAPLTLTVLAPDEWQIIANTRETEITEQGSRRLWTFPASAVISSYVYAMHAGPFTQWQDQAGNIPLRLFARNSIAPFVDTDSWFTPTKQSFAFFQEYFDVPYPFGKYDQVIVPDFNAGAMENVAAVTFSERYISRGEQSIAGERRIASVISHEMAHMWFGDLVTMDWWNGLWLNESFASYMGNLELAGASDFENIWDTFYLGDKLWAYETDQLITTHPVELEVPTTADAFTNFDGITYGKGGSILKQLPFLIGEENFRQGVSNYLKKYSYQNTTLADFVNELALAADTNLDQWQKEWLYESGVNTIQADFSCTDNRISSLRLIQSVANVASADKVLRSQRTQIGLYRYIDDQMILSAAIPVTYSGAVTYVSEATGQPCPDMVFPNEGDWAYMKINFDDISVATLNEHINDFDNATSRIMMWQSLWDSVDAAQLPLTSFVDFALKNIGDENDDNVVRLVSDSLASAFSLYSKLGNFDAEKAEIEAFIWAQLSSAEPGSELQKIWYASFVGRAHTPAALDYLAELLNGSISLPGLEIDQDKRWALIISQNRYQHGEYQALLNAEKLNDTSDQGNNMGLAAEAIRPDAGTKQTWLDVIINDPDSLKLATLRTVMGYLLPNEQTTLREQFAERILNAIPAINTSGTQEYVGEFVGNLSPAQCTPASVSRLAQANLDYADLQPLIVKSYLIKQQRDASCVAIGALLD